jgi:hypothetical protein
VRDSWKASGRKWQVCSLWTYAAFAPMATQSIARVASTEIVCILCSGGATVLEVCLITGGDPRLRSRDSVHSV